MLAYPEGNTGSIVTTEFVSVRATSSIAKVLDHVRQIEQASETIYTIYVLDPDISGLPTGVTLGAILGVIGIVRITLWQTLGL